ncbi:single-stranded DNA-binding protein [Mammaliicoccus sp. D-M17]|uniref:single-stranded DNA-binding protein n=1 Tax=Mammaliicoccus sp. D-M17 TaxID=2898677 RepID=UPI001EFB9475|nr:single-stranded DNA-binding protein [Mammaliicoccus sp. D-M17]
MNTTMLIGNITNDLEVKPAGQSNVLKFGLGVRGNFKKDETNFIQIEAWGKNAENIAKYFSKGSKIFIQGEMKQNRYEDKDGNKREKIYVNVEKFEFLDSKGSNQGQAKQQANDPFANANGGPVNITDEDLPF